MPSQFAQKMVPRTLGNREVPGVVFTSLTIITATIDRGLKVHRRAHAMHLMGVGSHSMVVKSTGVQEDRPNQSHTHTS